MKRPLSILVVEDDEWLAERQIHSLESAGFRTQYAPDGISAITLLDQKLPDAVVLDIFLPGPNGLVLLHEMKSYTDLASLPVIICTASTAQVSLEALRPYGVVEILDKGTMHPEDIVRAVRRVLL